MCYIEKKKNHLFQNQQANFNQIWYKLSWDEENLKSVQIKGQVLFKKWWYPNNPKKWLKTI
jgi:hypothetical protein